MSASPVIDPPRHPAPGAPPAVRAEPAAVCYHCGAPNPPESAWRADVAGALRGFCCAGCLAVAQTIQAAGLGAFYGTRTAASERPDAIRDPLDAWDGAPAAAGIVRDGGGERREVALLVDGLTCGACVWLLESWLARQPGVVEASINFATRRARVVWRDGATRLSAVLGAIRAVGYDAHPYDPSRHEEHDRREARAMLLRASIALLAMMQVMMFAVPVYLSDDGVAPEHKALLDWASLTLTVPVLAYCAAPFFRGAWRDLRLRRLGMDVPIVLGIGAAFAASAWSTWRGHGEVYFDSVTMFVALVLVARYVELVARQRATAAIERVARQRPEKAERLVRWPDRDEVEQVAVHALAAGDVVLVRPGMPVPADGVAIEGSSHVEEALLTGESRPRPRGPGAPLLAGSVNREAPLVMRVTAAGEATRLAAIVRLTERAANARPPIARIADRAAAWFVGGLLLLTAVTALVWWQLDASRVMAVTFALLVVSCPCALSLATPAALAAGAGALGARHVVLSRGDALETLARVTHVVFDKTGTLTEGRVRLAAAVTLDGSTVEEAGARAVALEARSEHPIAGGLRERRFASATAVAADVVPVPGQGIEGTIGGTRWRIGRPGFVAALAGPAPEAFREFAARTDDAATLVALGSPDRWSAAFAFTDALRADAGALVERLVDAGVEPVILSGDRDTTVAAVARTLGIADARGDLTPEGKRDAIGALQARGAVVAMVGDGVNDAPALAQAQVSASLGSATPLAQWTADVVVLGDRLTRLAETLDVARRTLRVVRENLAWATVYNVIAIPAAAAGLVTPLFAALGMSISSLLVVGNAFRLLGKRALPAAREAAPARPEASHGT